MLLEFYVEEPSAEAALIHLIPAIIGKVDYEFEIYQFQGKRALLSKLPNRLKAYRHWLDDNFRIIVLVDRDDDNCRKLKLQLEQYALDAGLRTRSKPDASGYFHVINRIAVEEFEAWFFGDVEAIVTAYGRVSPHLAQQAPYRDPDAIKGGTWEKLEGILKEYHPGGLEKIRAAEEISQYMNPDRNRSRSFQVFRDLLRSIFE